MATPTKPGATPQPPRLVGDPGKDVFALNKYVSDVFQALVGATQLPTRLAAIAAVDVAKISNAGADGKPASRTPMQLGTLSTPPTQAQLQAMATQLDGLTAAVLAMWQAAQIQ